LYLFGILLGSGIGFFMLSAVAMRSTSVLIGSTLIPGTAPVFVSIIALLVFKQHITQTKKLGLSLILIGVIAFIASALTTASNELLFGQLLLILCAFIWALFTISVRQSGLKPLQVSALVVVPNGLIALVWLAATQPTLGFESISWFALSFQIIVQGILVGIFSGLFYATAITKLGAEKTSAIGAATPVVATLLAIVFLKEALEFIPLLGLSLTAVGVVLASRQS
jgi:drug/metabolite transporter (DMT)-like permease